MSEQAKTAREAMKAKARRMCEASSGKVDASDLPADYAFEGGKQNQPKRPEPRAYKDGGKVHGEASCHHAGIKARVGNKGNYEGGTRPTGGRIARKHGGKTSKGKTNINIIIGAGGGHHDQGAPMPPPPTAIRPPGMMPPAPPGGMPMPPPGPPPGGGMPPGAMMPRKSGGRTKMTAGAGSGEGRLQKIELQKNS